MLSKDVRRVSEEFLRGYLHVLPSWMVGWNELCNPGEHYWTLLNAIECYLTLWTLLNTLEHCWTLLNTIECHLTLLNAIKHYWTHPLLSISMAYNVLSCKKSKETNKKIKIADFLCKLAKTRTAKITLSGLWFFPIREDLCSKARIIGLNTVFGFF